MIRKIILGNEDETTIEVGQTYNTTEYGEMKVERLEIVELSFGIIANVYYDNGNILQLYNVQACYMIPDKEESK